MNASRTRLLIAAAALAALPALYAPSALAQNRVGDDGRALDANNRIGSGGYNQRSDVPNRVSGNQVVTGNVTGGREFRGPVGYTDPGAFRGPTAGNPSDRFVRGSSGSAAPYAPEVDLTTPTPYYGSARAVAPPPGYVREGASGGYIPAPVVNNRVAGDQRLGIVNIAPPTNVAPQPGELFLPGPVDPSAEGRQSFLTASPLYGVRQWNADNPSDSYFLSNYTNYAPRASANALDDRTLQRYRNELNDSAIRQPDRRSPEDQAPKAADDSAQPQALVGGQRLGTSPDAPKNEAMPGQFTNPSYGANSTDTGQGQRHRLLVPPEQQSAQYAELQRRLDRANADHTVGDAEANRQYQELRRAQQQGDQTTPGDASKNPYLQVPAAPRPQTGAPQAPRGTENAPTPQERPAPVPVQSLATGVHAPGLANLLKRAEELMAEGKFAAALDQYDAAQQVAPNNPLILLGRANAELGAGFYSRAEAHIREAILTDSAVLVGQYDLAKFIGEQRLQTVVGELKEIARTEQRQTAPVFLLSWIAYNTGNARQAAAYLDLAQKRAGGSDAIYRTMRHVWQLPAPDATDAAPVPESNK